MKPDLSFNNSANIEWSFPELLEKSKNFESYDHHMPDEVTDKILYKEMTDKILTMQQELEEKTHLLSQQTDILNQLIQQLKSVNASINQQLIDDLDIIIKLVSYKTIGIQLESNQAILKNLVLHLQEKFAKETDVCVFLSKHNINKMQSLHSIVNLKEDENLDNESVRVISSSSVIEFDLKKRIEALFNGMIDE